MTKLLHISASPRSEKSESLALSRSFLSEFTAARPDVHVETWDLWDGTLPPFGPDFAAAKMSVFAGVEPTGAQGEAWRTVHETFARFDDADLYLFSVPMWNAGVPYILKQLIDVISQPGLVFGFDPEAGYTGLLEGKRAAVIYTGAVYGHDRPRSFGSDYQQPFFADWLRWAGIEDIEQVEFRPNLAVADADARREEAHVQAAAVARRFARTNTEELRLGA